MTAEAAPEEVKTPCCAGFRRCSLKTNKRAGNGIEMSRNRDPTMVCFSRTLESFVQHVQTIDRYKSHGSSVTTPSRVADLHYAPGGGCCGANVCGCECRSTLKCLVKATRSA